MKIERTKRATKNIVFGTILKLYQIIVPFLMRTAVIYFLGIQYVGLNSLFKSVLQVLNLAELGVGSAMVFSMYKPIVEDDSKRICALMNLYKKYYRTIGLFVFVSGMILCPFIPYLIKSDLPEGMNVYILYLLNLLATVFSYWLFAYKNSILQAHQRSDVVSRVTLIVNTLQYILQFLAIMALKDYYIYVIISLLAQIAINILTALQSNRLYPNYKAVGEVSKVEIKSINQRVKDLFTAKIGAVVINSADTIVISAFLGLTALAIYQNYFYILTAITGVVGVIFTSCLAGIGNSIIIETSEKNYNDLNKFTFLIVWLAGMCMCALICLYQPFMELWVGKELVLNFSASICFALYYFIYELNALLNLYKDAAGIWHTDRFRPLITALSNLALNVILVNFIGLYGVLLSTVLTMFFIGMPWLIHNIFTEIFKRNSKEYVIKLLKYILYVGIISIIVYVLTNIIQGATLKAIILKGIICAIAFNILFILKYIRTIEMKESIKLIKKVLKIS